MPRYVVRWKGADAYLNRGQVQNPKTLKWARKWFWVQGEPEDGESFATEALAIKAFESTGHGFLHYVEMIPFEERGRR